jgi:hypothetical protein
MIEGLSGGDQVGLVLLSDPTGPGSVPPQRTHDQVNAAVNRIQSEPVPADLASALQVIAGRVAADEHRSHRVVLLSGFREGVGRVETPLPPNIFDSERVQLEFTPPADHAIEQVRIVDVQPLRRVVLRNGGVENLASQSLVHLVRDGDRLPATVTQLTATAGSGRSITRPVDWISGQRDVVIDLELPIDDEGPILVTAGDLTPAGYRHVLVETQEVIRVVLLDRARLGRDSQAVELDAAAWLERALQPIKSLPIDVRRVDPVAVVSRDLTDVDAVFLLRPDLLQASGWQTLEAFLDQGGLVTVMPPGEARVHAWTEPMIETLKLDWTFATEHDVHEPPVSLTSGDARESILTVIGSELPDLLSPVIVSRSLPVDPGIEGVVVLRQDDGRAILVTESRPGRGTLVYLAMSPRLDWTSLPANPFMVPLMQEILRGGLHLGRGRQEVIVGDVNWRDTITSARGEIHHGDGSSILMDGTGVVSQPGIWSHRSGSGQHLGWIVANVDAQGGDLDRQSAESLEAWLNETSLNQTGSVEAGGWSMLGQADPGGVTGQRLVWLLLWVLAGLLLIETLMARWFSPRSPSRTLDAHPLVVGGVS